MLNNVVCGECRQQAPSHRLNCSATKTICGQCFHAAPYHDSSCSVVKPKDTTLPYGEAKPVKVEENKSSISDAEGWRCSECNLEGFGTPNHTDNCSIGYMRCLEPGSPAKVKETIDKLCSECKYVSPDHIYGCSLKQNCPEKHCVLAVGHYSPCIQMICPEPGCKYSKGHTGPHVIPPKPGEFAYEKAREVFSKYAAMDAPKLPPRTDWDGYSQLQVRLHRWHEKNFDRNTVEEKVLGVSEELGEASEALLGLMAASGRMSHAVLKHSSGIRGMGDYDKVKTKLADAVADSMIFATQLCTLLRVDFGTLYKETVEEVLKREWKKP